MVNPQDYTFASFLLITAGKEVDEKNVGDVLKAAGLTTDDKLAWFVNMNKQVNVSTMVAKDKRTNITYAALLLISAGKEVNEKTLGDVLTAAGLTYDSESIKEMATELSNPIVRESLLSAFNKKQ